MSSIEQAECLEEGNPKSTELLADALSRNLMAYESLAPTYESTSRKRLAEAPRWLHEMWPQLQEQGRSLEVLELGPADGLLTGLLSELGHNVTAVEFAPTMARLTRKNAPLARVIEEEFLGCGNLNGPYDILLVSAFVHLFPPSFDKRVLEKCRELLKLSGSAFIATTIHSQYATGFMEKSLSRGVVRYRTEFTRSKFYDLIQDAGFKIVSYYEVHDRFSPHKLWGNWVVTHQS